MESAKSMTRRSKAEKPEKPYKDFPLSAHPCGQWCKKIYGKIYYFGPWDDPEGAEQEFQRRKAQLTGKEIEDSPMTVRELCNHFLATKRLLVDRGKMRKRSWNDYQDVAKILVREFGPARPVETLRAVDFENLIASLPETWGPTTVNNFIVRAKPFFNYAYKQEYVSAPVRTGVAFTRATQQEQRKHRAASPKKFFTAAEIRTLADQSTDYMRAMILCGINLGFGNTDCSTLLRSALDTKSEWYVAPRTKTGVVRMGWLWPETTRALDIVLASQRRKCPAHLADRVFVTKYGNEYAPDDGDDAISKQFSKLKSKCGLSRTNVGFYALRHVTQTIGEQAGDPVAVKVLMGHVDGTISERYREHFDRNRVKTVCERIRDWYLSTNSEFS